MLANQCQVCPNAATFNLNTEGDAGVLASRRPPVMKALTNGVKEEAALETMGNGQLLQKMSVDEVTEAEQRRPSDPELESLRASDDSVKMPGSPKT